MNYLIVGGSSAAGQSAMRAVRQTDSAAQIYATTSKEGGTIEGVDHVIGGIDLNDASAVERLIAALPSGLELEVLFYTPAFGPIGYPVAETPAEDVKQAMAFCYDPMVALTEKLKPRLTIGYSAFYWKPHLLAFYGSLAYVKLAMEKLAIDNPKQYRMIRAGSFVSKATRGISVLLQRQFKKSQSPQLLELAKKWKASGKKFNEYFFDYIYEQEAQAFDFKEPYRSTTEADLEEGALQILRGENAPVISLMGAWHWTEDSLPELPADFTLDVV